MENVMSAGHVERAMYHYFFGSTSGKTMVPQIDTTHLRLIFPNAKSRVVEFDSRQQGVLIAFDGTLLWGSLPRRDKALVYHEKLLDLCVPYEQLCAVCQEEEMPQYELICRNGKKLATIPIFRSVVLLPFHYRMVVRKYNEKSLRPKYMIVTADEKSATWLTTSR